MHPTTCVAGMYLLRRHPQFYFAVHNVQKFEHCVSRTNGRPRTHHRPVHCVLILADPHASGDKPMPRVDEAWLFCKDLQSSHGLGTVPKRIALKVDVSRIRDQHGSRACFASLQHVAEEWIPFPSNLNIWVRCYSTTSRRIQ